MLNLWSMQTLTFLRTRSDDFTRGNSHHNFVLALFIQFSRYKALPTCSDYIIHERCAHLLPCNKIFSTTSHKKIHWYGHTWITSIHISTTLYLLGRLQLHCTCSSDHQQAASTSFTLQEAVAPGRKMEHLNHQTTRTQESRHCLEVH